MARRKKSMFKQTSTMLLEDVGKEGNWNSFARLKKSQNQLTSAYVDKVRISFIMKDARSPVEAHYGLLFAASTSSTLDDDDESENSSFIISASSSHTGTSAPITLWPKRRIVTNEMDPEAGDCMIDLFVKSTDPANDADIELVVVIETWGRWHSVQAL